MDIGNQIRRLRMEKKVTQEELASYLNVSAQAVSKWENQASAPDISLLPGLATFFGVAIDELFAIPKEEQYERIENMWRREAVIPAETFQQSVRFLQRDPAKDGNNIRALKNLACLYNHRATGDRAQASEYAARAIWLDPDDKSAWVAWQEANHAACGDEWYDNHFSVIEFCREVLKKYPENYRALYTIIENLLADKRYNDALPYIKKIGETAPHSQQMLVYFGDVALGQGDIDEAKCFWNQAVEKYPRRWQAWCDRADRMKKLGFVSEAIADYEKSMEIQAKPRLTDPLYSLAQVHEQMGDYNAAICDNERILQVLAEDYDTVSGKDAEMLRQEIERLKGLRTL